MYSVTYTKHAAKVLAGLARNVAKRIIEKIEEVAAHPYGKHPNVTKLSGPDAYRLRAGDWRVIYELDDANQIIVVLAIGPRGQVYR